MAVLKDLICPSCKTILRDQILEPNEVIKCPTCDIEMETHFGNYKIGTGFEFRPSLARKGANLPKKRYSINNPKYKKEE
jgi:hypothetical protein